jgi:hypothetical protein
VTVAAGLGLRRASAVRGVAPESYAGYSTTTGLLIDMGRLNAVSVDRRDGTMTVGGGALTRATGTSRTGSSATGSRNLFRNYQSIPPRRSWS